MISASAIRNVRTVICRSPNSKSRLYRELRTNYELPPIQLPSSTLVAMAVIVQKYGRSSVADVQKSNSVASRVMRTRAHGHNIVVVVSAMGDATDELLNLARQVS